MYSKLIAKAQQDLAWYRLIADKMQQDLERDWFQKELIELLDSDKDSNFTDGSTSGRLEIIQDGIGHYVDSFTKLKLLEVKFLRPKRVHKKSNLNLGLLKEPCVKLSTKGLKLIRRANWRQKFFFLRSSLKQKLAPHWPTIRNVSSAFGVAFTFSRIVVKTDDLYAIVAALIAALIAAIATA